MISIIIPAHNESAVIKRTLQRITAGAHPGEMEIIVVANGCSDATADVVRAFNHPNVCVIETEIGSKTAALNLGDAAANHFPRLYVDADVLLPIASVRAISARLMEEHVLAAGPSPSFDLTGCSWAVRAYYDINARLPSSREGIGGSGVYGLSEKGRRRFSQFPDVTADDGFVRIQFHPEERETLSDARSIVFAPKTLRDLIAIKTRSHFGSYELTRLYPDKWANKGQSNSGSLLRLWKNPLLWPRLMAYCGIKVVARQRARNRFRAGGKQWERDESSRQLLFPEPIGSDRGC